VVFDKICIHNSKNGFVMVGRHYYPWLDQLCVIENNETCITIFLPIFFLHYFLLIFLL
jgi:hypothetical protein